MTENNAAQAAMQKLKPCPFCGGSVELEHTVGDRSWWGVICRNTVNLGGTCAVQILPSASKEAAIERWDMRAPVADSTLPIEKALYELVNKIAPGLDTGDLVQDARRASTALDAIMASAPVAGEQSVTSILLEVVPGDDGMGHEVYATSVEDVKRHINVLDEELEEWELGIRRLPASAPVAGETQPVCWIERAQLESVCDEGNDAWVYWRETGHAAEPDEVPLYAAPQASEAARSERLERANKLPEVECPRCELKVISSCGSRGCPTNDGYADLCQTQADKDGGDCAKGAGGE